MLAFAAGWRSALAVPACAAALGMSVAPVWADDLPRPDADGTLQLTLADAVGLALARNRSFLDRRQDRDVQRLALEVAEERWTPRFALRPFVSQDRLEGRVGGGGRLGSGCRPAASLRCAGRRHCRTGPTIPCPGA
ncbi:MAG: hypothetical protein OXG71_06580 [Rhodospirillales bacterium]|nr:hypothetical protein [Rhodospirillales bacterium]